MTPKDDITIEKGRANELEPCACCGANTRLVRGFVYRAGTARAIYLVRWTVGQQDHDAEVVVSIGGWCDADASPRAWVALTLRQREKGPAFMVVDAQTVNRADDELLGEPKRRSEVVGTPLAEEVFAILDAVALQDERVSSWRLSRGAITALVS